MIKYLKYLPIVLLGFQDVSKAYTDETGQGRPWYLSRTFTYSALCFLSTLIGALTGVKFEESAISVVADNIPTIVSGIIALIGACLTFVAQWKSAKYRQQ